MPDPAKYRYEATYASTYVIIYQTMEFGIKDENFLLEVEGNDKYSRVKLEIRLSCRSKFIYSSWIRFACWHCCHHWNSCCHCCRFPISITAPHTASQQCHLQATKCHTNSRLIVIFVFRTVATPLLWFFHCGNDSFCRKCTGQQCSCRASPLHVCAQCSCSGAIPAIWLLFWIFLSLCCHCSLLAAANINIKSNSCFCCCRRQALNLFCRCSRHECLPLPPTMFPVPLPLHSLLFALLSSPLDCCVWKNNNAVAVAPLQIDPCHCHWLLPSLCAICWSLWSSEFFHVLL